MRNHGRILKYPQESVHLPSCMARGVLNSGNPGYTAYTTRLWSLQTLCHGSHVRISPVGSSKPARVRDVVHAQARLHSTSMKDPRKRQPHKQSNSYARHCVFSRLIQPEYRTPLRHCNVLQVSLPSLRAPRCASSVSSTNICFSRL